MSKIEVNTVAPQCGTTLTLGESGDTVTLGSGASQSGFGRTGTVDWQTSIKTNSDSPLTVENGKGYFLNTSSGTITVNLPAGNAGDIVAFKDYLNTWDTSNVTLVPNGSDNISGNNTSATLDTESQAITLIFADSTRGWLDVQDSTSNVQGAQFIAATGGTVTTVCTNFKVHTFTGPGTFCVSSAGNASGSNKVSYLVIAGGASGGADYGGGGGAGGFREGKTPCTPYTASPLNAPAGLPISSTGAIPVTVGAGGAATPTGVGNAGNASIFSTITSAGGGGGGPTSSPVPGGNGGSGGGGGGCGGGPSPINNGGTGNTPSVSPPQGNNGGGGFKEDSYGPAGGGGGATATGVNGVSKTAGNGGAGATTSISGSPVTRAGGGGGGIVNQPDSTGGSGGSGGGGSSPPGTPTAAGAGTVNTGSGGAAGGRPGGSASPGAGGGSGIVIIRYKFQ